MARQRIDRYASRALYDQDQHRGLQGELNVSNTPPEPNSESRCEVELTDNSGKPLSILLVEDNKPTLEILADIIAKKYPRVALYTADDGKAALDLFKAHQSDIVITDVNMPEMSGVQMADGIRAIKPGTKFVVLTGDTDKITGESSVGEGVAFDHYIIKPVRFGLLFEVIEQCIATIVAVNSG